MHATVAAALREFRDDPIALDALLFPRAPVLYPHQRVIFRALERHPFCWVEASRGGAKTSTVARWLVNWLLRHPRRKAIVSGPTHRQAKLLFKFAREFVFDHGLLPWNEFLVKVPTENTESAVMTFTNGSSITALPASGPRIHGYRAHILVLTEFFEYDADLYRRTILPMAAVTLDGQRNRVVYETTAGYQFHFSYQEREKVRREALAGNADYGFLSFTAEQLLAEGFPLDQKILGLTRDTDEAAYRQAYQNAWLSDAGSFYVLSVMMRRELRTAEVRQYGTEAECVVSLDTARSLRGQGDDSAMAVVETGRIPKLVYAWAVNNITAEDLAREVAHVVARFPGTVLLVMDYRGGGDAVRDRLYKDHGIVERDEPDVMGRRLIVPFPNTPEAINSAHHALRTAFDAGTLALPVRPDNPDDLLVFERIELGLRQLADLQTRRLESGWMRFTPPSGRKRDVAYAILYAYWGAQLLQRERLRAAPPVDLGDPAISSDLGEVLVGLR